MARKLHTRSQKTIMASVESTTGSDEEEWPPSFYGSSQQSLPVAPTKTGWRRLLVCIGIKIFGKKQQDACDAVGISRSLTCGPKCCRRVLMRTDGTLATCGNHCDTIPTIIKQSKVLQ